ncbi:hypothetical protein NHX12_006953 [Muraenolepis orangiensis]|uniref:Uncharacterized protein n=1 Tax=Muraenolepis orangiensis TaxID=630683 RepID=A0A9Q0ICJ9_9TELE|nr:hypothetical protein NHX12_006953 [Muraenolepis orangiensis]
MKATNSLLQHYEMALKAELETKQENYNSDKYVHLRVQLVVHLDAFYPTVDSSLTENQAESMSEGETVTPCDHQTGVDVSSSIDMASLHLNKTQDDPAASSAREEEVMEEPGGVAEEEKEWPLPVTDDHYYLDDVNDQRDAAPPHSSPPMSNYPSPPERMKLVPSTPTFSIRTSSKIVGVRVTMWARSSSLSRRPGVSPGGDSSHRESPAFLFSANSDPSTPGFPGFGFDMGSAQEEDSPFAFTSSYFGQKKSDSKSPSGPGFVLDQSERPEGEFHFSFSRSPGGSESGQEKAGEDAFPFSFTFS